MTAHGESLISYTMMQFNWLDRTWTKVTSSRWGFALGLILIFVSVGVLILLYARYSRTPGKTRSRSKGSVYYPSNNENEEFELDGPRILGTSMSEGALLDEDMIDNEDPDELIRWCDLFHYIFSCEIHTWKKMISNLCDCLRNSGLNRISSRYFTIWKDSIISTIQIHSLLGIFY